MCLSTSCIHLVSYVGFPPLASPQLLAFIVFQYPNFSCAPVPLSNFLHAFDFNTSASPVSQQLLALIWFQYLTFPLCLSSNFFNFLHSLVYSPGSAAPISLWHIGFPTSFPFCPLLLNFYSSLFCAPLGNIHLASMSKLPPLLVPLTNFLHSFAWSQDFTSGLLTTFCMHLNLVSMSKLPPLSLNNFLRSSGFNHWVSISILSPQPPHNFLRSCCFNI